jgi:nucleotide-binding universal stress UspA family protein
VPPADAGAEVPNMEVVVVSLSHTRPLLVGYDGSEAARAAVLVGAGEAAAAHRPLHIVHVVNAGVGGALPRPARRSGGYEPGDLLADALDVARLVLPAREIDASLLVGDPAAVLLHRAGGAHMVVVGRGAGPAPTGSVALTVAARAGCPVVVVPDLSSAGPVSGGTVVVGISTEGRAATTLEAGLLVADAHGAALLAVHAWQPSDRPEAEARRDLHRTVQTFRAKFDHLAVAEEVVQGCAGDVLVDASAHARLLVVGARSRGNLRGGPLGPVTLWALRQAHCAVLVARERAD